jgi:hypothetical protein
MKGKNMFRGLRNTLSHQRASHLKSSTSMRSTAIAVRSMNIPLSRTWMSNSHKNPIRSVWNYGFSCLIAFGVFHSLYKKKERSFKIDGHLYSVLNRLGYSEAERDNICNLFDAFNISNYDASSSEDALFWLVNTMRPLLEISEQDIINLNSQQKVFLDKIALNFPHLAKIENRDPIFYKTVLKEVTDKVLQKNRAYVAHEIAYEAALEASCS